MCVYNGRRVTRAEYIRLKKREKEIGAALDGSIGHGYDYGDWPIVRPTTSGNINIARAKWGFISPLAKVEDDIPAHRKRYETLNAKGETLVTSPMYKHAAQRGYRCLVLSTGFFEHRHIDVQEGEYQKGPKKGEPKIVDRAFPYHIDVPGQDYFFMAGIWWPWTDVATGKRIDTFAIVTTEANELMAQIHNSKLRMPTILPEDKAEAWLFEKLSDEQITELATYRFPSDHMQAYSVAKDFKKSNNPFKEVVYDELPALQY